MKVLIGGVDYVSALDAGHPLTVQRTLNEPSLCRLWLSLPGDGSLAIPTRNQSVAVMGDDGTVYFTGYLAVSPLAEYAGLGLAGPVFRLALEAVSDEVLLDSQEVVTGSGSAGATVAELILGLAIKTGLNVLRTAGLTLSTPVGHFSPQPGRRWSALAGQAANYARAAYRAVGGALTVKLVGSTVHALSEADGSLDLANLALSGGTSAGIRPLANDVTVCGQHEPVAYVTEYFRGDGEGLTFALSEAPFVGSSGSTPIIDERFRDAAIDLRRWGYSGPEEYYSITGSGLTINGGSGVDGNAALMWNDRVEAGGLLLLEAAGVALAPGSTGTLAGVYNSAALVSQCLAGFAVTSATGTGKVSVAPLISGVVLGRSYALDPAHQYTLRVRLYCAEAQRAGQVYRTSGDNGLVQFGGSGRVASGHAVLELQEVVDGVYGMPVVLYDGAIGDQPGSYVVAAASSINLIGTMRAISLTQMGSGWVTSTPVGGGPQTRRLGTLAQAGECFLSTAGLLTFYPGLAPAMGELIVVNYRTVGRSTGRAVNAASQASLAAVGWPAAAVWMGTVTDPPARSSMDCRNAAKALVAAAASVSAAWSGKYTTSNMALNSQAAAGATVDVWPGDALLLTAASHPVADGGSLRAQVVVRQVELTYSASQPDLVQYAIDFSNDWANDLAVKTSSTVPDDAWLPAEVSPTYLANLLELTVDEITAAAVKVQANVTAPAGGGFEVRRRDFAFQPGQDVDMVLRSPVPNFDIPRSAEAERFYVRMYDGSTPPNYSEFSAALFVNLPLS